jgi:hypothetical protein
MSLAFGSGGEPDLIGALSVPRSLAPGKGGGGEAAFLARPVSSSRDFLRRATASPRNRKSAFADGFAPRAAVSGEEKEIRNEFGRIADVAGLNNEERAALFGEDRELSRVILALETVGAALDLFREPTVAVAWLRGEDFAEPFNGRTPLRVMAADGRLGVEITLLYLRARLRLAPCGA